MRDAHRGIGGIDGLPARPRRTKRVNADFLRVNLDFHLVGFRQDGHRDGGSMDAALLLGGRDALHAMNAAFEAQPAIDLLPFN